MMIVEPNSHSLVLRATHILVVHVESATAKPWAPRPAGGEERMVSLSLKLDEAVKGIVKQRAGDLVKVDVKQARMPLGHVPGVWSSVPIDPGTRLVAFGGSDSEDAAASLADSGCIQVVPAEVAIADVHLAARAEAAHADLAGLLAEAKPVAASLGWLFADYLWERHATEAMSAIEKFDSVAILLEDPKLGESARTTLIIALTTAVEAPETPPEKLVARLAVALFRVLGEPDSEPLHDNLVATDLPGLLGIEGGEGPHQSALAVFHDYPAERPKAEHAVRAYKGSEPVAPLLAWLKR